MNKINPTLFLLNFCLLIIGHLKLVNGRECSNLRAADKSLKTSKKLKNTSINSALLHVFSHNKFSNPINSNGRFYEIFLTPLDGIKAKMETYFSLNHIKISNRDKNHTASHDLVFTSLYNDTITTNIKWTSGRNSLFRSYCLFSSKNQKC